MSLSTFASVDSTDPSRLNAGLSQTGPPSLGKDGKRGKEKQIKVEDEEVYSDPDEGVEIVDMDQVQKTDWLAPDILRRERRTNDTKIKQEKLDDAGMSSRSYMLVTYRTYLSSCFRHRFRSRIEAKRK
jgi:DNA-directed RNA polymerase III subunit RPC4